MPSRRNSSFVSKTNLLLTAFHGRISHHRTFPTRRTGPRIRLLRSARFARNSSVCWTKRREIDLGEISRLTETLLKKNAAAGINLTGLEPAPYVPLPEHGGDASEWAAAKASGEDALRAGRVAAFTVAGGQGTRLGYDGPKGTFPVTPLKKKTLFQVFAEKIKAAGVRYGRPLHWFIMTSHQNHAATEAYFAENGFFGLDRARVHFFRQGRMPAVNFEGKILLESKGSIALSPDGHGGSLRALERSGALDIMEREGIDTLSYFQVDNPLVRCIDPSFIGWHLQKRLGDVEQDGAEGLRGREARPLLRAERRTRGD